MKKLFTLVCALMGFAGAANAATVDDIEVLKHSYVLVCDDYTNNGTGSRAKNTLFGDNHFLDLKGGSVATNKGQVDLSVVDALGEDGAPLYVTQDIVDKYGEYGKHYNSLRLKNTQDMIVMKVTAKSKIIMFIQGNNKVGTEARIPRLSKNEDLSDALNPAPDENHPATVRGFKFEYTVPDDMTLYVGSYNGDMFVSYIIVEANEAPGTPTVKVGEQKYEGGLWFREVTCKANPATEEGSTEQIPTLVTYTTDGSAPTADSPIYTEPIKCYQDMTVKFQAFLDIDGGKANPDFICDGADNEANVNFQFDAPAISAEGANVTITSPYEGAKNFYALNGADAVEGSNVTLTESATVTAYSQIVNGSYATFTTKTTTKDVYVLNAIKERKLIEVVAGDVVVDEEATATSTTGTVYKVENGAISADKADFFVKNLEFGVVKDAAYQIDGKEAYIKMNSTNITFFVEEGDTLNVKVIVSKNSCKTLNAENDETVTTDRKCYVNVSGTTYGTDDITVEGANIIEFGLRGAEGGSFFTFQKYSGTGNIFVSSIELTPVSDAQNEELVLWEGESLVTGWANQPMFLSDGGTELVAAGAAAGDVIRIYGTAPTTNWQVELFDGHWHQMYQRFSEVALTNEDGSARESIIVDLTNQGYFDFTITDAFLTDVTAPAGSGGTFLLNGDGDLTVTKIALVKNGANSIQAVNTNKTQDGIRYNLAGQKVSENYKGVVIMNGKKFIQK